MAGQHLDGADGVGALEVEGTAFVRRQTFRQQQIAIGRIGKGQHAGKVEGGARTVGEIRNQPAQHRAEHEACAPGSTQQAIGLGAVIGRCHIGDIGIGGGEGGRRNARHRSADEQPPDVGRKRHDEIIEPQHREAGDQDRAPAEAVRQIAEDGGKEEVHQRIDEDQRAAPQGAVRQAQLRHLGDQARQHGHDDAQADGVDQDGDEEEGQGFLRRRAACLRAAGRHVLGHPPIRARGRAAPSRRSSRKASSHPRAAPAGRQWRKAPGR